MKTKDLIAALLAISSSSLPALAEGENESLRSDCAQLAENIVAAAAGHETLNEAARASVVTKEVRVIRSHVGGAGVEVPTYRAKLESGEVKATVIMTATRGGCFLEKMKIEGGSR